MGKTWNIVGIRTVSDVAQTVTIATVHELEYHAEWMGDEYVTVTVKSPTPIDFHFGDYLIYRSEYFRINYDPNVVKKAALEKFGEGFTYDNIKLYSDASKTKDIDFKDVVLNPESAANTQVYTSLSEFSFYAASVEDLADRLQANLNRESSGWRVLTPSLSRCLQRDIDISDWNKYYTVDGVQGETDVNIEITVEDKCWQVVKMSYEKFGLAYCITGRTIVIGGDPVKADHIFRYGKNNGLYEVERTSDENQEIVTKLFAYGSEQNLPLNYYANIGKKAFISGKKYVPGPGMTGYYVHTDITYSSIRSALMEGSTSAPVILTNSSDTHSCTAYLTSYLKEGSTVQYVSVSLSEFIWIGGEKYYSETPPADFYGYISDNETLYIKYGVNINAWPDSYIEVPYDYDYPSLLSINKLMLPGFPTMSLDEWVQEKRDSYTPGTQEYIQWQNIYDKYVFSEDKHDPWIISSNMSAIGIREGIVNYDGSSQKEIFPTIANTDSSYIQSATVITDNGYLQEKSDITFHLYVYRGNNFLDWAEAMSEALENVYVEMTSGFCTGRKFKVNSAKEATVDETAVWDLTCERDKDTSLERYFPYFESDESNYCQVQSGDTFVVTGIQMPDLYIEQAAERLFIAACGYLDRRDHMRYTYLPKVDEIYMQRQDDYIKSGASDKPLIYGTKSYHDTLHAGMQMEFEDTDLGIWHTPYIDQLAIKENGNEGIPTYEVVLRDEKEKGTLEKLTERISELQQPVIAPTERQTRQTRNAEYPEWIQGNPYYYQTLNPVPFEGVVYIETSYVWHRGCLWMCLRTLTTQEPWFTAADWKCVRAMEIALNFFDDDANNPHPITNVAVYPNNVNFTVKPYLLLVNEDITQESVSSWKWRRESEYPDQDAQWNAMAKTTQRQITFLRSDLPIVWGRGHQVEFVCTATLNFEYGESNTVINRVRF